MNENNLSSLPTLKRGEGVLDYLDSGTIRYRKTVQVDGKQRRLTVSGGNIKECFDKMAAKERTAQANLRMAKAQTLVSGMEEWLVVYKEPKIKPSSYDRIRVTFKNQIQNLNVANMKWREIQPIDLQKAINSLVAQDYAYSTIKKVYDLLNSYFTFQAEQGFLQRNPMALVSMPSREHIKPPKDIVYMKEDQIKIFSKEALSLSYGSNVLKYRYGPAFVFLIYTGLRVGELCALQWKDLDFEKNTVSVTKNLTEIYNRDYNEREPLLMKQQGIKQYTVHIGTTKTFSTRIIPLNAKALNAIKVLKEYSEFTELDDYIVSTSKRKPCTPRQMDQRLNYLLRSTDLELPQCGCHMLRHTCASLMFAKKMQVEIIASILGHSAEVCRKTYIHFCQEQKAEAIHQIAEFDI